MVGWRNKSENASTPEPAPAWSSSGPPARASTHQAHLPGQSYLQRNISKSGEAMRDARQSTRIAPRHAEPCRPALAARPPSPAFAVARVPANGTHRDQDN
jgi:hypothetical protein